ncbi:host nuclease inhibitor protein [Thalassospira marina]|uniref:Host nuclease inhibitor protein n=1 Tax=Thalassospira marina TaxID=2048283 RepID=A0A2N3KSM1_9PROT|nr:host nuclease inhibitor protein [Thalassospira marina]PKR53535.1 host nuclease inhibitor protein [Thalassospira marina]
MCKATLTAFCWRTGKIEFGTSVPEGAMAIMTGPASEITDEITSKSRLAYDGKTLLVPGIPEAPSAEHAKAALDRFVEWVHKCRERREARQCKR